MTDFSSTSNADPSLAQEASELRERLEDQFSTQQILHRRFIELLNQEGLSIKPILITEKIKPLTDRSKHGRKESDQFEPSAPQHSEQWWPTGESEPSPQVPHTGWANYSMRPSDAKALGISICGLSRKKKRHIVEMIALRQKADRDFRPVFLTDSADFTVFVPFGFAVEYIQPPSKRHHTRSRRDWERYVSERRDFVVRKWGLQEIIQFGPVPFGK